MQVMAGVEMFLRRLSRALLLGAFALLSFSSIAASSPVVAKNQLITAAFFEPGEQKLFAGLASVKNSGDETFLLEYSLKSNEKRIISLPEAYQGEHLAAVYPLSNEKLLILTQFRKTSLSLLSAHEYDLKKQEWKLIEGDIACVNITKKQVLNSKLVLSCGADQLFPPKKKNFTLDRDVAVALVGELKWFPQEPTSMREAQSLELFSGTARAKKLSAKELFDKR